MRILFIGNDNLYRSIIAQAYIQSWRPNWEVFSCGVNAQEIPLSDIAQQVLQDDNIEITKDKSTSIQEFQNTEFDLIFILCDEIKGKVPQFFAQNTRFMKFSIQPFNSENEDLQKLVEIRDHIKTQFFHMLEAFEILKAQK